MPPWSLCAWPHYFFMESTIAPLHKLLSTRYPVTNVETSKMYKRQDTDAETRERACALDRFEAFYRGNNTNFVTECRSVATMLLDFDLTGTDPSSINIYRTFCIPDCGNVVLDAYDACKAFDSREQRNFFVGLCGFNENGNVCYELFSESISLITLIMSCTMDCDCRNISEKVKQQGCCFNDIVNGPDDDVFDDLDLDNVYDECNVTVLETGCNNSTLRSSSTLPQALNTSAAVAMLLAVLVYSV